MVCSLKFTYVKLKAPNKLIYQSINQSINQRKHGENIRNRSIVKTWQLFVGKPKFE